MNDFFYKNLWSDGLPIVPPTLEKVKEFLKYTDRSPDEVLSILEPGLRKATVWKVAVNGVMAGCRPEYMPILIAVVETIADPHFCIADAGSTSGWEPLIILNGPIIKELGFNNETGVLRVGNQANTSVGRFLRLFMRNVAGYLPGRGDMGTFGRPFYPVLAENEDRSPWDPLSVDRGFKKSANIVTVVSVQSMSPPFLSKGDTAEAHLEIIAREIATEASSNTTYIALRFGPEASPVLVLTPLISNLIAKGGYSKSDIRQYLFKNARIPASKADIILKEWGTICDLVKKGALPKSFCETSDPNRMLPIVHSADDFLIVVSGDPSRNRSIATFQPTKQGLATSKAIKLPANWDKLMAENRK